MIRSSVVFLLVILLSACELLPTSIIQPEPKTEVVKRSCIFMTDSVSEQNSWQMDIESPRCELKYWLNIWRDAGSIVWTERKQLIEQLSQSPDDELHKYLLSQPVDTPYQVRLRAQNMFNNLQPFMEQETHSLFEQIAYKTSQQLLEFESAITILSKVNARHAKTNEEQAQLLLEQEEKINQLLNIEASILDKNSER